MSKNDSTTEASDAISSNIKRILAIKALRKIDFLVKVIEKKDNRARRAALVAGLLLIIFAVIVFTYIQDYATHDRNTQHSFLNIDNSVKTRPYISV